MSRLLLVHYYKYSFGENFWKVEMLMDCSKTYNAEEGLGWFELKTYVSNGGWEGEIIQVLLYFSIFL